ncbi:MAG: efflux RND transporter permease subunit [Alkalispirochaetaceae bacterium]
MEWLFQRRKVMLLLFFILVAVGVALVALLPVQLYPQTQRPRIFVRINHSGYSAVDFSRRFGDEIENRLLATDGVDSLQVEYQSDSSDFTLTFDWQTDSDTARSELESTMSGIRSILPAAIRDDYFIRSFAGENAGFLLLGIRSPSTSPETLHAILKGSIESDLSRVNDAEEVEILNIEDLEVDVLLRPATMLDYGLTIGDIDRALRQGYLPEPVGSLEDGDQEFSVRYEKGIDDLYDIGGIVVADRGDLQVRLQDVAEISIDYTLPSQALVVDGEPSIRINATPKDGGNIRQMSEDIRVIVEEARSEGVLPADTELQFYVDPAEYINQSIRNVIRSALLGAALAMVIVFLALGEVRNTFLIGISLPATLILAFILMYAFGVSLNLISLGGIALAVGMVIDSAIVVIENIHRHYLEADAVKDRASLGRLIATSVAEVRAPVIASTVTTILVFLPISFTAPLANAILGDQASTVIFALLFALLVALTLLPLIAFGMYKPKGAGDSNGPRAFARLSTAGMEKLTAGYRKVLKASIATPARAAAVVIVPFLLLAIVLLELLPLIPREIISPPSSDRIVIFFRSGEVTDRVEIVEEVVPRIEEQAREVSGEDILETYALVSGRFNIFFVNLRSAEVADEVLGDLQQTFVSDNTFYYNVSMWDPAELPLPRTNDLQISLRGEDETEVVLYLEELRDLVNESGLYGRVFTDPPTGLNDELSMTVRREVVEGFPEITADGLVTTVSQILRGTSSIEFEEGEQEVTVAAGFPDTAIGGRESLSNFLLSTSEGVVPLKHFFDFREEQGVAGIASEDGERIFRLYARMPSGTPASRRQEFESQIRSVVDRSLSLPSGYAISFDNPQSELDEAIRSLIVALGVSVLLIYLVVAFQFNSLRIPLVILVTVPLGFIGVVVSLYIFNSTLSLNSLLGTILLGGIVVNNAILMIDFYEKMSDRHQSRLDALVHAAGLRFPPILITTLTTILGMLPLAIGLGEGSNIVQPLGIAVSGGLLVSTTFTLFVVPGILRFMRRPAA